MRETAHCLHCKAEIDHRVVDGRVIKGKKSEGDWYVKWALKEWNKNYERYLRGEITLEELKKSPARPTLLAKAYKKNGNVYFEPATPRDIEELWKAVEEIRKMWGDPDVPTEELGKSEMRILTWGFDKFYKLLNPRQLLVAVKLVKLIREVARRVEEEKLKEGDDAKKYAEAIATYLVIALVKYLGYNSYSCYWDSTIIKVDYALALRGIGATWNWVEQRPDGDFPGTFSQNVKRAAEAVEYLSEALSSAGPIKVLLGDAAELSALEGEKFDVVVTDPPYADDVAYAELSDFYYVWIKRALSENDGASLRPKFLAEAFFDDFGIEIATQWQMFGAKEVSEFKDRWERLGIKTSYAELLTRAFANVLRFLKEDGLLVVYYVAKKPEAWVALVDALWRQNNMAMIAAYPIETESEENVVARGKASVLGGYVSVWRKRNGERPLDLDAAWEQAVEEVSRRVAERIRLVGSKNGATAWVYYYLAALEYLTAHYPVRRRAIELGPEEVAHGAVVLAFDALLQARGVKVEDRAAHAYLALRIMESESGYVDSDALAHVERATGLVDREMEGLGLIRPAEAGGPRVAKRKVFEVLAPRRDTVDEVRRAYSAQRGKSPVLDCFRQLQLNALAKSPVTCTPEARQEAIALAKALVELGKAHILDEDDTDVKLARVIAGLEWYQ
jgi:putative DNA methylase